MTIRPLLRGLLLAALLLRTGVLRAQIPAATAAARYRYWEADPDSLRRVLATQRADTARLRILLHLLDRYDDNLPNVREAQTLAARLGRPEARALRLLPTGTSGSPSAAQAAAQLDSVQAAIAAFDRLGRPVPNLLSSVRTYYNFLNRQEERRAYYQAKLRYYQARGATENTAACHHGLGGYYSYRGDFNQSIGHYLQAADLYRGFDRFYYYNEIAVVGDTYADWGNPVKALPYLRQAQRAPRRFQGSNAEFLSRAVAQLRLGQHDYPAALQAAEQALRPPAGRPGFPVARADAQFEQAYGLVLKSAVLLAQGRAAEAGPLLRLAQPLADSLHIAVNSSGGRFELDAAWARYYAQRHAPVLAEARWLAAYRKAGEAHIQPLRLAYLRGLAEFYQSQRQPAPAARYALAAAALADTLSAAEGALHVARYEIERAERTQQQRIAGLRLAQVQEAARARRQRLLLGAALAVLAVLAGLGFVLWRGNRRQQQANAQLQAQRDETAQALKNLQTTQAQLIQAEKMASLGELTAGIAHEIQNPLNFVNNFADVSTELLTELKEAQAAGDVEEVMALADDLTQNMQKISQHGQRAAGIVRGMLEHSRASTGERTPTDVNALADEYLRLAYHGLRAKDKTFNATLHTDFAPALPSVEAVAGDLGRVLLNLFTNAFYAVRQRQQAGEPGYTPTVGVGTERVNGTVVVRVRDNGVGMPPEVQAKIFQPFFTTKPTGEGTGLGLSLSHDIVVQGHGGTLTVESRAGEGTAFTIQLPTAWLGKQTTG